MRTMRVFAILVAVLTVTVQTGRGAVALFPDPTPVNTRPAVRNGGNAWGGLRRETPGPRSGGRTLSGRVTHVRDGDTVEVGGVPVRIANLDCAERGTVRGDRATARLKSLLSSGRLDCQLIGERTYDRVVGTCRMDDGRDIGAVLVSEGVCRYWQ